MGGACGGEEEKGKEWERLPKKSREGRGPKETTHVPRPFFIGSPS